MPHVKFLREVTRRHAFGLLACGAAIGTASADVAEIEIDRLVISVAGSQLNISRYVAAGQAKRPALAAAGLDAVLFSYYEPIEAAAILRAKGSAERERLYGQFARHWVARIHAIADQCVKHKMAS